MFAHWGITFETQGQEQIVADAVARGTAVAISDGLYQEQVGVVAWTIESKTNQNCITGQGQIPGGEQDQSAYCSKLFRIWGIMTILKQILQRNNVQRGKVLLECDRLTALWHAQSQNPVNPNGAHYN